MLIDTDVLIWCLRGNAKALKAVESLRDRSISQVTRMELVVGCRSKTEIRLLKRFLVDIGINMIPISAEIGGRADVFLEEKHLSHGVGLADALIAATASIQGLPILTGNIKHFRCFPSIVVKRFAS
jgi:predicted nucleic acid-binding protein